MQIIVDGLLTTYEQSGTGRTVVLLHGWGDRSASFAELQTALARNFRVITPDLPGFGATQAPPTPWGLDEYAHFVATFLKKLEVKNVYAFIGHSNGGAILIRGLGLGVLACQKLILLATAGIRDVYNGRRKSLRLLTKFGKTLTTPLPQSAKKRLRQKVYATIGSDMLVAEHLQETFKKVVTDDVQADAARLAIPALLIYGEQDTATPVGYGQKFHELMTGSTLEILPAAGHFIHHDRPKEVIHAIQEYLT